jgi:hypothetical protein
MYRMLQHRVFGSIQSLYGVWKSARRSFLEMVIDSISFGVMCEDIFSRNMQNDQVRRYEAYKPSPKRHGRDFSAKTKKSWTAVSALF